MDDLVVDGTENMWIVVSYSCKKVGLVRRIQKGDTFGEKLDQIINIFTFMDDLVVDGTEKMWILALYRCKRCFIKEKEKKNWALQKHLSDGYINGDHLLKRSGCSDQYFHFNGWFSGWKGNLNLGLIYEPRYEPNVYVLGGIRENSFNLSSPIRARALYRTYFTHLTDYHLVQLRTTSPIWGPTTKQLPCSTCRSAACLQ